MFFTVIAIAAVLAVAAQYLDMYLTCRREESARIRRRLNSISHR